MSKRKRRRGAPGLVSGVPGHPEWKGASKWDVWENDPIPWHRQGLASFVVRSFKKLYLGALGPFHRELFRRQRDLNRDLVARVAALSQEIAHLKRPSAPARRTSLGARRTVSFTIVFRVGSHEPHERQRSLDSVAAQAYNAYEIVDVAHGAKGEYIFWLDPGDELLPGALSALSAAAVDADGPDIIYTDDEQGPERHSKPGWSPDLLWSGNYVSRLAAFRRTTVEQVGGVSADIATAEEYDLLLKFASRTPRVVHVSQTLYRFSAANAANAKSPTAQTDAERVLKASLSCAGMEAAVSRLPTGQFRVRPAVNGRPLVSIVIPTKDHAALLERCTNSIAAKTTYKPVEVIIVDHASVEPRALRLLASDRFRVVREGGPFNFSRLVNAGARHAKGDFLLFLNNDTEVLDPDWILAMLEHAQRPEIGAVGAKLLFPSGRIQHAGMTVPGGDIFPMHALLGAPDDAAAFSALAVARNCVAVTGACLMVKRSIFESVGGFDERYAVEFGDVDLCLRLWEEGYRTLWTSHAVLCHREFGTRKHGETHDDDRTRFLLEWGHRMMGGDPFFHRDLLGPRHR